tara:strand:+ start:1612 stop:2136 length:525 start_codon:yes stop_codon:yes gene_type:complete
MSSLNVNTIAEYTSGNGVTIDGVLIKDGNIDFISSTYTCTVKYDTDITETNSSNYESINITGYYYQIGKLYHFWLPTINRTTVSLSADFIIDNVSLPATTSSTNNTINIIQGYNLQGRYASTDYTNGYPAIKITSNSTTASTQFYGTQGTSGQGKLRVYGSSGDCNISGWFIGA